MSKNNLTYVIIFWVVNLQYPKCFQQIHQWLWIKLVDASLPDGAMVCLVICVDWVSCSELLLLNLNLDIRLTRLLVLVCSGAFMLWHFSCHHCNLIHKHGKSMTSQTPGGNQDYMPSLWGAFLWSILFKLRTRRTCLFIQGYGVFFLVCLWFP